MSIISNAKEIADLIQKVGNQELYKKILDLQGEIINLTGENHTLKQENQELNLSLKVSKDVVFDGELYWLQGSGEGTKEGPYCQCCYDSDRKLIRLQNKTGASDYDLDGKPVETYQFFVCLKCKNKYSD